MMESYENAEVWTKEEYASLHWENIKDYITTLDNENDLDDSTKMMRVVGYMEAYFETYQQLKYDFEV